MFTQEFLQECFTYNSNTGVLQWKRRPRSHFTSDKGMKIFNTRTAGSQITSVGGGCKKYSRVFITSGAVKKHLLTHRVIWMFYHGCWPETIDHINGNGLDNRLCNLRDVSHRENSLNTRLPVNNKSGKSGVTWYKQTKRWQVKIGIPGKQLHIGFFLDKEDALKAREQAEKKYRYHPNHGQKRPLY